MKAVRVALIGAGGIAQAHLDVARQSASGVGGAPPAIEIVAIVEPDVARAKAAALKADTVAFARVGDLLDASTALSVDAAIVCTPPSTHPEIAVSCLEHGLHVLCEKPLAIDRAGAHRMLDAAARTGLRLTMASKFRYVDDMTHAKTVIESGELGDIVLYRDAFTSVVDMADRWNSNPAVSGGGVIIDNGTHSIDIARYLLGPIRQVIAVETRRVQPLAVEDTAQVLFRTDAAATGTIDLSWSLHTGSPWYVTVDGTKASLRLGWKTAEMFRNGEWVTVGSGYDKHLAFAAQLDDFAASVRGLREPIIDANDMLASVAVIDAAYRSIRTGAWVQVVEDRRRLEREPVLTRRAS